MANIKTFPEILGDMITALKARTQITDFRAGSNILTLLEAIAHEDFLQYYQMYDIVKNYNLDSTEGDDLNNRALEIMGPDNGRKLSTKATTYLTISDSSITKISTKIYSGAQGPIKGQQYFYVDDASSFTATGNLIIGRNTSNVETIAYTSIVNHTNYYEFVLGSTLVNDHGNDESVILSQGGLRQVNKGTIVKTQETDNSYEMNFEIESAVDLLDGEDTAYSVPATCKTEGSLGNVGIGAINLFDAEPFTGATVTNDAAVTNGTDEESDFQLRDRIKTYLQSLSRGTAQAIKTALIGLYDSVTNKSINSVNIVDATSTDSTAKVYIDDGTGLEPSFSDVSDDILLESAQGGEQFLQTTYFPLVKASVFSINSAPFNITAADKIDIQVDDLQETITFVSSDYVTSGSVLASEISTAINSRSTYVECRVFENGTKIMITPKSGYDKLTILGTSTAVGISKIDLSTVEKVSLSLYKIDSTGTTLLYENGSTAKYESATISGTYDLTGTPYNFKYQVDGTKAVTVDFREVADGGDIANGTYGTKTAVSALEIIAAINAYCPGITASLTSSGNKITVVSNTELSSSSKLKFITVADDLAAALGFTMDVEIVGLDNDYTLNRLNGQIELNTPLVALDQIVAGTGSTRAFAIAANSEPFTMANADTLVIKVDGANQTVTFATADFVDITAATVAELMNVLNRDVKGITAYSEGGKLAIVTNNWASSGSLEVVSATGTGNAMGFTLGASVSNIEPHIAYRTSQIAENYNFDRTDNLIVVLDNDTQNKTYNIYMGARAVVTTGDASAPYKTMIAKLYQNDLNLNQKFTRDSDLVGMKVVFTVGGNAGQTDTIASYVASSGTITLTSGVSNAIAATDQFYFIPVTAKNVVTYLNNTASSTLSFNGTVSETKNGYVQIATNTVGTGGLVNVVSGTANLKRLVSTAIFDSTGPNFAQGKKFTITLDGGTTAEFTCPASISTMAQLQTELRNAANWTNPSVIANFTFTVDGASDSAALVTIEQSVLGHYFAIANSTGNFLTAVNMNTLAATYKTFNFSIQTAIGRSGYSYYTGLIGEAQKTIDGMEANMSAYPGYKAVGVHNEVSSSIIRYVTVSLNLTISGRSNTTVNNEVKSKISNYINGLGIGEDVILSEIIAEVKGVNGVDDVSVLSPASNIIIRANELAKIKSEDIILG
jgi:uncharacterized phage protein gp47/JayE